MINFYNTVQQRQLCQLLDAIVSTMRERRGNQYQPQERDRATGGQVVGGPAKIQPLTFRDPFAQQARILWRH